MDAVKDRLVATLLCCTLLLLVTSRSGGMTLLPFR